MDYRGKIELIFIATKIPWPWHSYLTRSLVGKALEKSCKWLLSYAVILKAGACMRLTPYGWLVIYPMSGNNAMLKIDFTDPRKRSFVRSFLYTGSEMIHLPWINVRRINLNEKFSRSSRPVFLKFLRNSHENTCAGFSF